MSLLKEAASFAQAAHRNQRRKYTNEPYWYHCEQVARTVDQLGGTDEQVAAAWLHDTVEDTDVTQEQINRHFGDIVGRIVDDLTDKFTHEAFPYLNREERKGLELKRLARIAPMSKTVKLADIIDNTNDIVRHDPKFAIVYLREKAAVLEALGFGHMGGTI